MALIRPAAVADIPHVHAMAKQYLLSSLTPDQRVKNGFLVSNFSIEHYERLLRKAEGFFVLEAGQGPGAFILSYTDAQADAKDPVVQRLKQNIQTPFLIIKQICVDQKTQRSGAGRSLYQHLDEQFPGMAQFAAVVLDPENTPSIVFHERLGFSRQFEMSGSDGYPRGIWGKPPSLGH